MEKNDARALKICPSSIIFFIVVAGFVYLLLTTWLKWGELITDTPRELLTPYQILQGKVIYKDIFYPYGFFPPYLIATIYKISGVCVNSLVFCGLAITVLMSFLLYKIARFFLDEIFSGLVVLTFLFVFAFGFYVGNGIFNYILPYSFASTFFMLFATASLYFFIKFILTDNKRYLFFWCIAVTFSLLSRQELSILIWIGFSFIGLIKILKFKKKHPVIEFLFLIVPILIGMACYVLYIFTTNSFSGFNDSIILCLKANFTNKLTIAWAGLDNIIYNSLCSLGSFSLQLLIVFFLAVVTAIIQSFSREKDMISFKIMSQMLLVFVVFFFTSGYMKVFSQYRCLPLLLLTGLALSLPKAISSKDFNKDLALSTLFLISLLLTLRIFLNTTPHNYGFYLLNLSIICYYIFFASIFKNLIATRIRINDDIYLPTLLFFFLLLIIPHWQDSLYMYAHKHMMFKSARGSIACFESQRSARFLSAAEYLSKNTSKDDTMLVFPEGASFNFFTERPYSSRYYKFLPPDIETIGEDRMLSELISSKTDYIIILSRDTTEYGYSSFGFDYAKKLYAWINKNYEIVKQFGPLPNTTTEFGIAILRKKVKNVCN